MYAQVLVATDGSELATRALDHAIELAKLAGSTITVVTVTDPLNVYMGGYAGIAGTTGVVPNNGSARGSLLGEPATLRLRGGTLADLWGGPVVPFEAELAAAPATLPPATDNGVAAMA